MTEHVHEWRIKYNMTNEDIYAESHSKDGKWLKTIFKDELEARLNATERLSAGIAELQDSCKDDPNEMGGPFVSLSWVVRTLEGK